ncbi:MAG: right-handed parallel beta-helix repeat-containing protein [Dokdonella sp.]
MDPSNIDAKSWLSDRIGRAALIGRPSLTLPAYTGLRRHVSGYGATAGTSTHRAETLEVTSCDDSGSGSLRDAVASAVSGDTIDLSQLTCSTITLTSAFISVLQDDLSITGPGATSLAVDGGGAFPLFAHYGSGTLSLDGLSLTNGYYSSPYSGGGCIYSTANIVIQNATVAQCYAKGEVVNGGAIIVRGDLTIVNSVVTHNHANGIQFSSGGAAFVGGDLTVQYSTISDNVASNTPPATGQFSVSGGLHTLGNVLIQNSTISGNQAKNVAALVFEAYNNSPTALIINSTVSGNAATYGGPFGGAYTAIPLTLSNSTIAFNNGRDCSGLYAVNAPVVLQSSIIADNVSVDLRLGGTATVSGVNNLINNAETVPADTVRDCPQLGPLSDNGGITLTHLPRSTSPAIDRGSNVAGASYDQRGTGFARTFGAAADIGALEWHGGIDDSLFNSGFESICDH